MKYTFTIVAIFLLNTTILAQSINFSKKSSDSISGDIFAEMSAYITIENIGATQNTYLAERFELSMTPGHSSYFCWSIDCYPTNVSLATSTVTLNAGEKDSTFIGYLTPFDTVNGHEGTSVVKYVFFDQNNSSDSLSAVFVYTATSAVGIETRVLNDNEFYAYPNPASNSLNIAFGDVKDFKTGSIIIRNALGSELMNMSFDLKSNITTLDVSNLERGVYFYTVQFDGQKFQTKKFAVSK